MRLIVILLLALPLFAADDHACGPAWGYDPATNGPNRWGQLDPAWARCDSGYIQSPVNLGGAVYASLPQVAINYKQSLPLTVQNTSHEIKVWPLDTNTVTYEGVTYTLIQFHFHVPAEHRVGSTQYAAELHLVHESDDGSALVLAVFFNTPGSNVALSNLPSPASCTSVKLQNFTVLNALLPTEVERRRYYLYDGSLTTPECTEGIRFIIFATPLTASANQISALNISAPYGNARGLQPLGARIVRRSWQ